MQFPSPVSIKWLASFINAELFGDENGEATGINEIHSVQQGDIVFVDHPKYYDKCLTSTASFIIINKKAETPEGKTLLVTEEPFEAYLKIVNHFSPFSPSKIMISNTAKIGEETVHQLDNHGAVVASAKKNVSWFQISVNDAGFVGLCEAAHGLQGDATGDERVDLPHFLEEIAQIAAF